MKFLNLNAPGIFNSDCGHKLDVEFNIYEDGKLIAKSNLPYSLDTLPINKQIELIATLPNDDFVNKTFISFRASGYSVKVDLEDNEIYSFYKEGTNDYGGGYWHFIRLPNNSNSKQIKIKLFCPSNNPFSHNLFPIYIGTKGYALVQSFGNTAESLLFGIILIIFGFIFFGNMLLYNRTVGRSFLCSLSLLLICLGCWVLFQSGSRQLIGITNPAIPMEISFFTMFALPFCLWYYITTNYKALKNIKILKYFSLAILSLYIPISIISANGVHYTSFLTFIGILILIYTTLILILSIKTLKKGNKSIVSCIFAISSILLSILIEVILLLLKINIQHISFLHTGMAITAIIFIYKSIGNLIDKKSEDNQEKLLKKLAYIDVVTLVENRNSYERFIETESFKLDYFGIILADINGLKVINDIKGHKNGDILLKNLSSDLQNLLPENSRLFRVGGDEFIGIIKSHSKNDFNKFVYKLQEHFVPKESNFGMSIGHYYFSKQEGIKLSDAIDHADKNMYKQKQMQKQLINKSLIVKGFTRESDIMRD